VHLVSTAINPNWHEQKQLHDQRRRFQLARLITLSEEMLEGARNGAWNQLEELELLRRVELEECFALQNDHPSLLISQALAALIHINDQIVAIVRQARDAASRAFQRDQAGHDAARAYGTFPD
jgi:hypothetical protein